jgi:ADP-ribose pyrophosphatase YjhB (NUDIX family)
MHETLKCDHKSVGILVWKDGRLLLIERRNFPFGFAPPAGHLDGDSYEEAAKRELKEEVGLEATDLKLLLEERADTSCRREKDGWHYWKIYESKVNGEVKHSPQETKQAGWYDLKQIRSLAEKTGRYRKAKISDEDWQEDPGIENVWLDWFNNLGII